MKRFIGMVDLEGIMSSVSSELPKQTPSRHASPAAGLAETASVQRGRASIGEVSQIGSVPTSALSAGASPWLVPAVGAAVLICMLLLLYYDFLLQQLRFAWYEQADWGHTLIVPFLSAYFVYRNRAQLLAQPFRTTWVGFIPMVMGVALYVMTVAVRTLQHHNLQGFAVWLTIVGLVLLFCGWRAMRWLWFPLVFLLVFGQTISARLMNLITFEMQDITARGAYFLLAIGGMEIDRQGNTLFIMANAQLKPLNIAEACSGMRMLMAFLALGVTMAYTGLKQPWQRVALVAMAVPTAIFVNILRVVTLALLSLIDTEFAAGDFHSFIGLVWLAPAFLIYLGLMWIIRHLVIEGKAPHT
jgi:exosortase